MGPLRGFFQSMKFISLIASAVFLAAVVASAPMPFNALVPDSAPTVEDIVPEVLLKLRPYDDITVDDQENEKVGNEAAAIDKKTGDSLNKNSVRANEADV